MKDIDKFFEENFSDDLPVDDERLQTQLDSLGCLLETARESRSAVPHASVPKLDSMASEAPAPPAPLVKPHRLVLTKQISTSNLLDFSVLKTGIYSVAIESDGRKASRRFVKP